MVLYDLPGPMGIRDANPFESPRRPGPAGLDIGQGQPATQDLPLHSGQTRARYRLASPSYVIKQMAYLPVEGIGVNGTFFIKGSLGLDGQKLFVSSMGFSAAKRVSTLHFHAKVALSLNGKSQAPTPLQYGQEAQLWPDDKDYAPIGSATIELPAPRSGDQIEITISGGYVYSAAEGRAVPIPAEGSVTIPLLLEVGP